MPNAGEKITIKVQAASPLTGHIIPDATVTAFLFAPPKNPQLNPGDRTPDHTIPLAFDPASSSYLGTQDTTGFPPGPWWASVSVTGGAQAVSGLAYQPFPLNP